MADTVIDASALAAVVFGEREGDAIRERCRGLHLRAPLLIDYEMANICLIKQRRHPNIADQLANQFAAYQQLDLERESVNFSEVRLLAEQTRLTAYDAAYLWLVLHHGCALTTLDKALETAWKSMI